MRYTLCSIEKRGVIMRKIRIGVFGVRRGKTMMAYCKEAKNVELVAICDKLVRRLEKVRKEFEEEPITYYTEFDEFIKHDMDAVVLANFAHEHAPYAIKVLKSGKHVFSEVLPVQNMKEAVELVEAVEESGLIYAYGENYCYMPAPFEMKKLYQAGKIGEFEYGEGEYIHNCESVWHNITCGEREHWRNNMYANFYCTHSVGPLLHITGLRPVSVTGFEASMNERHLRVGALGGQYGIEIITLENGGIIKSIHGDLYKNSIWYSLYGLKGRMESAREDAKRGDIKTLYVNADRYSGEYGEEHLRVYQPDMHVPEESKLKGHGGSDYISMNHFVKKILGEPDADIIDVYEALDMFLPGMFAYRSVLNGGIPMEIPNMRDKEERERYRNDTTCVQAEVAGDMTIPSFSKGNLEVYDMVYELVRRKWSSQSEEKGK